MGIVTKENKPINFIRQVFKPLVAQVTTTSTVYTIAEGEGVAFVVIPKEYLTANLASDISAILTIGTGVASAETVIIPIAPSNSIEKNNSLIIQIYIDSFGNVFGEDSSSSIFGPPVGVTYIQFPGKPDPADRYGGTWQNISNEFAGDFFRAEGGNASAFESGEQAHMFQTHAHNHRHGFKYNDGGSLGPAANATSSIGTGYTLYDASDPSSGSYGAETRPTNRTIRIWERIA